MRKVMCSDGAQVIPRRFLPSLTMLSAFEAAARSGSVTAAARELSLTQGAISRQIIALEEQLQIPLFYRERRKIRLTPAGQVYVREVRAGLRRIGSASMNLRANPGGRSLNLALPHTFGAGWLVPRLPEFMGAHPLVTLNLLTRDSHFHFPDETIDAAIYLGADDWPDVNTCLLCTNKLIPACSLQLKRKYSFTRPRDLRGATLMHLISSPNAWEQWLVRNEAPTEDIRGMLFDQLSTLAAAAEAGMGVAVLPRFLFDAEFSGLKLVPALDLPMTTASSYRLAWPKERDNYAPLIDFKAWLMKHLGQIHE
jgi:LysR family glycine cleavage system transcriptional activator